MITEELDVHGPNFTQFWPPNPHEWKIVDIPLCTWPSVDFLLTYLFLTYLLNDPLSENLHVPFLTPCHAVTVAEAAWSRDNWMAGDGAYLAGTLHRRPAGILMGLLFVFATQSNQQIPWFGKVARRLKLRPFEFLAAIDRTTVWRKVSEKNLKIL